MFTKDFFKYFFNTYKKSGWLILRYLICATYLTISSVIANKMVLTDLTYFNAVFALGYFADIIGYGVVNAVSVYFNQNIKDPKMVNAYIKIGLKICTIVSVLIITIFCIFYKQILHGMFGLPDTISYAFYFLMMIYIFLNAIQNYIIETLKDLGEFFKTMLGSVLQLILTTAAFLTFWLGFNLQLNAIAIIYIIYSICITSFYYHLLSHNKQVKINLFKRAKFKLPKSELKVIVAILSKEVLWQLGYILTSYFFLNVSTVMFNQYEYFEKTLDIFNGMLFAYIGVNSIFLTRKLGEGDLKETFKLAKYSHYATILIWVFYAILSLSLNSVIILGLNTQLQSTAFLFLVLYVAMHFFRFTTWNLSSYVLCAGGEVKSMLWVEIATAIYMIIIYVLSLFLQFEIYSAFAIVCFPLVIQLVIYLIILHRKKWMQTLNHTEIKEKPTKKQKNNK